MSISSDTISEKTAEPPGDGETGTISNDKIFHLLQTQRRRGALQYLKTHENPVEMRSLAEQIAAWENDTTVAALSSNERQRVYIALYQSHLPKLDGEDVIEYNKSRGIVERGPLAEQFDPYLETYSDDNSDFSNDSDGYADEQWIRYYRWATIASVGMFAMTWLKLPLLGTIASSVVVAFIICIYTTIAVAQISSK